MSTHYDLDDIMARLPVLIKAAMTAIDEPNHDAVDYYPYEQESRPYWWCRFEGMTIESIAADLEIHRYQVAIAMVIGHFTEGYDGETSKRAYKRIPALLNYWRGENARHLYDGAVYTSAPDWLWTERGGAVIVSIPNGTRALQNSGVNATQVAVVFTLEIPLLFELF